MCQFPLSEGGFPLSDEGNVSPDEYDSEKCEGYLLAVFKLDGNQLKIGSFSLDVYERLIEDGTFQAEEESRMLLNPTAELAEIFKEHASDFFDDVYFEEAYRRVK